MTNLVCHLGRNGCQLQLWKLLMMKRLFLEYHVTGIIMNFDLRLDHRVAVAWCLFVAGITLRSLAPVITWNKSKRETVCLVIKWNSLVVKCGCHYAYTNEHSDNGNQKPTSGCDCAFSSFLVSHCCRSVGRIYENKQIFRLWWVLH